MIKSYDVIVIGGGHAGCEAGLACARMGLATMLITINIKQIGAMSCNPAIGGLAKGNLVREIDALGGQMAKCIDSTGIQFRILNSSKGPAVHGLRAQADRHLYQNEMLTTLKTEPNLTLVEGIVDSCVIENSKITGVKTGAGDVINAKAVVLCSGTFLKGLIHIGLEQTHAGRTGEAPADRLSDNLRELGFEIGRLKTGTCPRLDCDTIDFSKTEVQPGDENPAPFSFFSNGIKQRQVACHITHTTEETQRVIENNLERSPLYTGVIEGVGPRYCPSIEDKVKRFPEKRKHQIFLEPEGLTTNEVYPNGLSTSLPIDVQLKFLQTIPGLENVEITRAGYAIEYDFCPPTQVYPTLETKKIKGLFFAGQINGTSGYEEAAAQGLIAGINAVAYVKEIEQLVLTRQNSYIGVMIDDLVTKGTSEPYRMFTSRAEFRLLLRHDNADLRLCDIGHKIGLLDETSYAIFNQKRERIEKEIDKLSRTRIKPSDANKNGMEVALGGKIPDDGILLSNLLKRPGVTLHDLPRYDPPNDFSSVEKEQVEITFRYEGYIKRQEKLVAKTMQSENKAFPPDFDFSQTPGLSNEVREKLLKIKPLNLGQASRISGVTPAALSALHIYLTKYSTGRA